MHTKRHSPIFRVARAITALALTGAAAVIGLAIPQPAQARTVTDLAGRHVDVPDHPQRGRLEACSQGHAQLHIDGLLSPL